MSTDTDGVDMTKAKHKDKVIRALEVCREKGATSFLLSEVLKLKLEVVVGALKELLDEEAVGQNSSGVFVLPQYKESPEEAVLAQIKRMQSSLPSRSQPRLVSQRAAVHVAHLLKAMLREGEQPLHGSARGSQSSNPKVK